MACSACAVWFQVPLFCGGGGTQRRTYVGTTPPTLVQQYGRSTSLEWQLILHTSYEKWVLSAVPFHQLKMEQERNMIKNNR